MAWQFDRKGQIIVPRSVDEEELMLAALDAGAEDIVDDGDSWRVTTPPTELHAVRTALDDGRHPGRLVGPHHGAVGRRSRSTRPRAPRRCCA